MPPPLRSTKTVSPGGDTVFVNVGGLGGNAARSWAMFSAWSPMRSKSVSSSEKMMHASSGAGALLHPLHLVAAILSIMSSIRPSAETLVSQSVGSMLSCSSRSSTSRQTASISSAPPEPLLED